MTSLYAYALLPIGIELPAGLRGIQDSSLDLVSAGNLVVVVSQVDADPSPVPANVETHHDVVVRLRQTTGALPVRFGTVFHDQGDLIDAVIERQERIEHDIRRLDGTVEYGISVLWEHGDDAEQVDRRADDTRTASGAEYMRRRLSEHKREMELLEAAERIAADVELSLERDTLESRVSILPTMKMPVRARFLVRSTRMCSFEGQYDAVRESFGQYQFLLVGPWPPYSFVTAGDSLSPGTHGAKRGRQES